MSQNRRKQSIDLFKNKKADILIASDVAARGLDIKDVTHIVNYDIPKTSNEYIHRIGRTARAGKEGKVISLLCELDYDNFRNVLKDRALIVEKLKLPEFQKIPLVKIAREPRDFRRDNQKRNYKPRNYNFHRKHY